MELIESQCVELKRELNDKFEKEIVGMLNSSEGGRLYLGVDDNGIAVGIDDPDDAQLQIATRLRDNILPTCIGLFDVTIVEYDGKKIVNVTVASGQEKPYYIKRYGMSPLGCFMRVGAATLPMTVNHIEELFTNRSHITLRNMIAPRQDLTFAQLKIYYESKGKALNQQFANSLELLTNNGKYNYLAYLLSDNNATSVKVAKYADTTKINLVENVEMGFCSLVKAAYNVLEKLHIENRIFTKITSTDRKEQPLLNETAIREIVVNALVHNDYSHEYIPVFEMFSDRLVVTSYGGLQVGQSEDDFFSGVSMPRNRELMRVFHDLELVEQLGSGMGRIIPVYGKNVYEFHEHYIRTVIYFNDTVNDTVNGLVNGPVNGPVNGLVNGPVNGPVKLTKRQEIMLKLMSEDKDVTLFMMSDILSVGKTTIKRELKILKSLGLLERVGSDKTGYWKVKDV